MPRHPTAHEVVDAIATLGTCAGSTHLVGGWRPGEPWRLHCEHHDTAAADPNIAVACAALRLECTRRREASPWHPRRFVDPGEGAR